MKKKSSYKKCLMLFTVLLSILSVTLFIYVYSVMVEYENSQIENYIINEIKSGKIMNKVEIEEFDINKYDNKNSSIEKSVKKLYKDKELVVKENMNKEGYYNAYSSDALILTLKIKEVDKTPKMLILTIPSYEIEDIETNFERGIYYYDIKIPSGYTLTINNKKVPSQEATSSSISGLEEVSKYNDKVKMDYYKMDNFVNKPDIKITDTKNKNVKYEIKDNNIEVKPSYDKVDDYEKVKEKLGVDIDIIKLMENWSLFLTDDLKGTSHGFNILSPYLIPDSALYKRAYDWAHNVDITFVSNHTLKNPTFTSEKLDGCIIYNDEVFSCNIYLEKNMKVNGEDRVDKLNDILYFVKYNGEFKLTDMKSK